MADNPAMARRRNAIVAWRPGQVLAAWPATFAETRPAISAEDNVAFPNDTLHAIAEVAAHQPVTEQYVTQDEAFDSWQNLLRWAGDLPRAQLVIERWQSETGDSSAMPHCGSAKSRSYAATTTSRPPNSERLHGRRGYCAGRRPAGEPGAAGPRRRPAQSGPGRREGAAAARAGRTRAYRLWARNCPEGFR